MRDYFRMALGWFRSLESRERVALSSLVLFFFGLVLYLGVWSPLKNYVQKSEADHDRYLELLAYLESTQELAKGSPGNPSSAKQRGQSLLSTVSRSAEAIGIKPSRLQPEGGEAVSVWFEVVEFTKLMVWLERLESRQDIVARQVSIDRQEPSGQVSARLVLRNL